jgi:hypothetical protein
LAGVRPPEPDELERLEAVAEEVRRASRDARLLSLAELGREFSPAEPARLGELLTLAAWPEGSAARRPADLAMVVEGERSWLYSESFMTRTYAEAAALAEAGDHLKLIAAAVRHDSRTYPRPTPVTVFGLAPYGLSPEEIETALAALAKDPEFADLQTVRASDGSVYLFSATHLVPDLAQALAEWEAVGQHLSP